MTSMTLAGRRKAAIILACVAVGFLATSTQYVHTGYVGVVDGTSPLRLLDRGLHVRAPWQHVVFYPTRAGSVGITTVWKGPSWTVKTEVTLVVSVARDSVASLHETYGGEYVQALLVPRINEFFNLRGGAPADWQNAPVVEQTGKDLALYLDTSLAPRGIAVFQAWLTSFEQSAESLE